MVILKYPLMVVDRQTIITPALPRFLSVQSQDGILCLWALVDPKRDRHEKTILIVGTGNPCPKNLGKFIGTVQHDSFVWHVFEEESL
jgi:hypothetical protein